VALIIALLVTALAATAAASMIFRQQIDIRRSGNIFARDQAFAYALAAETWAKDILRANLKAGNTDTLSQVWAKPIVLPTFKNANIALRIQDLQGRFNLNDLVGTNGKPVPAQFDRFRRLLMELNIKPDLAYAVVDWVDPDLNPIYPNGAEDDYYTRLSTPYRAANRPMASASELRLVAGFDEKTYRKVRPYVTALPAATAVNVNTAPPAVLQSLAAGLTASDAKQLAASREQKGFASVGDFLREPAFAGRRIDNNALSVNSAYFELTTTVDLSDAHFILHSLLYRSRSGQLSVLARALGPL